MYRPLLAGLLTAGIVFIGLNGLPAQGKKDEKKEQPKKKERIAIADPKDAAKDPDFAIQGEYEGTEPGSTDKTGAQIIARGEGLFAVKIFNGGLPGDGWDGKNVVQTFAKAKEGFLTVTPEGGGGYVTPITNGTLTLELGKKKITFKKVERKSKTLGEKPPSGAVVLFGKEGDEKNWNGGKLKELSDGKFLDVGITSKESFGPFKAHIEFRLPWMPNSTGQQRGNSGVYFQNRYECQVLDSFGLNGENNECGGIYTQHKPLVNMCYPPLVWQTYDIEFTPAEFGADGKKTKPAHATVFHNGVKIHDNVELKKETGGGKPETKDPGPFQFQNHGDPVVFRNVWVVATK